MTWPVAGSAAPAVAGAAGPVAGGSAIAGRKIRILCLHGYLQDSEVFRMRIGSLRKALKSRAEFMFVDAPYPAEPTDAQAVADAGGASESQGRSWWRWTDVEPGMRPSRAAHYSGWDASRAAIRAALDEHAPIDGLLGFSQGATAAALYLADTQPRAASQQRQDHLRFAVVVAGFLPRDASYAAALRRGRPALPSLHVHGAADALVPEERSRALWECFAPGSARRYTHSGAHMVPTCSGEFKALMQELLDDVRAGREKDWLAAAAQAASGGGPAAAAAEGSV